MNDGYTHVCVQYAYTSTSLNVVGNVWLAAAATLFIVATSSLYANESLTFGLLPRKNKFSGAPACGGRSALQARSPHTQRNAPA